MTIAKLIKLFKTKKILVVGDIMLDKYVWGEVKRISPEAPVQVVTVLKETYTAGGAANVAANITSLGGTAYLVGIAGNDSARYNLFSALNAKKIITSGISIDKKRPTTQKLRIIGHHQQLLRVDYENKEYLDSVEEKKMIKYILNMSDKIDGIVVSDYAKGVITKNLMANLVQAARKKNLPIIVDPKPKHFNYYNGSLLITPNHKEACEIANEEEDNGEKINEIGHKLMKMANSNVLITRGEKGMSLFKKDGAVVHIPTAAKEVYDVTGAGDTVIAALSLAISSGMSLEESANIANHAAGITVAKVGTSTVSTDELLESFENKS